jgi:hypothetical protein
MGVSFTPQDWEKLSDLRERHERLARRADKLRRLAAAGRVSLEECERAERLEREAYSDWRLTRAEHIGEQETDSPRERVDTSDELVPRDL